MSSSRDTDEKLKLSEEEEQLLSAYIDGELDPRRETKFRAALPEQLIDDEIAELHLLRQGVRDWFGAEYQRTAEKNHNLWAKIAPEIEQTLARRQNSIVAQFGDWVSSWSEALRGQRVTRQLGVACALGLALTLYVARPSEEPNEVAFQETFEKSNIVPRPQVAPIQMVGTKTRSVSPLTISGDQKALYLGELNRRLAASWERQHNGRRMRMPVEQVLQRNFVLGGLRTGGLDIDWIKSDKQVRIVAAEEAGKPPVLWVARQGSIADLSGDAE